MDTKSATYFPSDPLAHKKKQDESQPADSFCKITQRSVLHM